MDAFAQWLTPFLSSGSLVAVPLVVLGGIITAFNPCCLPMYPAVFGYLGQATSDEQKQHPTTIMSIALVFVVGMATATSLMGLLTAMFGWVFGQFPMGLRLALAAVPLIMGLHLLELIRLPLPTHAPRVPTIHDAPGSVRKHVLAYGAGILFTLAIAPCATPILISVLTLVALEGDLTYGSGLMFIYGLGAGLPLLLAVGGFTRLTRGLTTPSFQQGSRRVAGVLLLGVGLYLIWTA